MSAMKQLFAKVAVQNLAASFIWRLWAFCAMCVSWDVVAVCIWMYMTDTHDDALCCSSAGALPREIILSHRCMPGETGSLKTP